MAMNWRVIYYEMQDGQCPVQEFIDSRSHRDQAKVLSWIAQLEEHGPTLPRPYADLLDEGVHELRVSLSGDPIRVLYFFCYRHYIVLTHTFAKNTQKVPRGQITRALRAQRDFLIRFDEETLKEELDEDL
jgi:phage-related protein